MKNIKSILIAANLLVVLTYFGFQIHHKEQLLDHGTQVRLELAPVDPRSLMHGDYMALRYKVADDCTNEEDNYVVVNKENGDFVRSQKDMQDMALNEVALKLKHDGYQFHLSSESYFFEEGTDTLYEHAKYALVVVDTDGSIFIKNLCYANGEIIVSDK